MRKLPLPRFEGQVNATWLRQPGPDRATVVHDIACRDRVRPYEEVHYMLYEAMLCDGVTPDREALMYTAVRLFGPKWRRAQARQRTQAALRDFDPRELARTLDHALHERTRWRRTA